MNRKRYNRICFGLLLLLAAGCFQSCQQEEDFEMTAPGTLLSQGRYLAARNGGSATAVEDNDTTLFAVNTPYRLLAFTKQYDPANPDDNTLAAYPRFNRVAWEGATANNLHYINLDSAYKWFGFAALEPEWKNAVVKSPESLVSLDFYGFTFGKAAEGQPSTDYIELDGLAGETTPANGSLATLKRTESVSADGTELSDLLRGELLNRNIGNAGLTAATAAQSILPFRHCFSQLIFCVGQQHKEETGADGKTASTPYFPDLQVEKVEVTNTYGSGSVYLQDGKVELLGDTTTRPLQFHDRYIKAHNGAVTTEEVEMGRMIVFPSHGSALKNTDKADGYNVGLKIGIKSTNKTDIANFLKQTNPAGTANTITEETAADGKTYYKGTIVQERIIEYSPDQTASDQTLRFKQNTRYRLVIWFSKNDVRIITVIPQVEEWLPGEGTAEDPWQEQAMGQPQMFDNIVWSDRNLGADHYDPLGLNFEKTIGYFYQSGRNIPYYPFDSSLYYDEAAGTFTSHPDPTPEDKQKSVLANVKSYWSSRHRFYPMVDPEILNMKNQMSGWGNSVATGDDRTWMMERSWDAGALQPQMDIPETKPTNTCFDFMRSRWDRGSGLTGLNMKWDQGQDNQPVSGAWVIPTSSQFMSIFPSTPHAGNITFRAGGHNNTPMTWGNSANNMNAQYKTLRVTVPYYYDKMEVTSLLRNNPTANYLKAWYTLKNNNDIGTTHDRGTTQSTAYTYYTSSTDDEGNTTYYYGDPGAAVNVNAEPDGDPEDGYASVYVISRSEESVKGLPESLQNDGRFYIKSWGTIYGIKRVYTAQAYRMRWRVLCAGVYGTEKNPGLYVEVCRYRYNTDSGKVLTEENYLTDFDWDHPASTLYFPICGLGDWTGNYINFGTECQYATSDPIVNDDTMTSALQMKITGHDAYNAYIAIVRGAYINRDFGKQIRPIRAGAQANGNE